MDDTSERRASQYKYRIRRPSNRGGSIGRGRGRPVGLRISTDSRPVSGESFEGEYDVEELRPADDAELEEEMDGQRGPESSGSDLSDRLSMGTDSELASSLRAHTFVVASSEEGSDDMLTPKSAENDVGGARRYSARVEKLREEGGTPSSFDSYTLNTEDSEELSLSDTVRERGRSASVLSSASVDEVDSPYPTGTEPAKLPKSYSVEHCSRHWKTALSDLRESGVGKSEVYRGPRWKLMLEMKRLC